jgi:L-amino acid N-acyltransferase YncA
MALKQNYRTALRPIDDLPPKRCNGDRGRGFGTALFRDLMDEAAAVGKAVSIHVEKFNPAMRFYRRLGFTSVEDKGVYDLMHWSA